MQSSPEDVYCEAKEAVASSIKPPPDILADATGGEREYLVEKHTNLTTSDQDRVNGSPALTWTTLARAERIRFDGRFWSVDEVVRKALSLLEREVYTREEVNA